MIERSGDDLWLLYTGGTTGSPKGVMWPHRSLLGTGAATFGVVGVGVPETPDDVAAAVTAFHERGKSVRLLPAAPLMHGTSAITSAAVLSARARSSHSVADPSMATSCVWLLSATG